ncbi:MAG: Asp-tRNA(Asn)/Glu-tRNA(Gln) amidotransferase A subunit family amidase [Polaribacter sp.]|jgi:Asp-tRNA(Asn)/Glu-tRNA(Gln) amidotransferase A subunit family amidase
MIVQLNRMGFAQMAREIRDGRVTAEAIMQSCLERIEQRESEVGAFICYDADAALAAACLADQTEPKGLLHGVPFGIKDIINTDQFPTGWGTTFYNGYQPTRNASCIEMFIRAGGIPFGKTVTTEFAYFKPGKTANPHNLSHTPGGSSSGSAAAVADGMLPFGFGSQTAASLIRPAAYCGIPGYKASHGSFDLEGVMSLSPNLDTLGFLAREVEDFELARSVLCGSAPVELPDFPLRISLFRGPHWMDGSIEMRDVCHRAMVTLKTAGAQVGELACPEVFKKLTDAQKTVMAYDVAHARIYEYSRYPDQISAQFRDLFESGLEISRTDFQNACITGDRAARILESLFIDTDVILTPAAPGEAPAGLDATGDPLFSRGWNLLQVPCVSIPYGKGPNGLPLSVQLVGRLGADDDLLAAAKWVHKQLSA